VDQPLKVGGPNYIFINTLGATKRQKNVSLREFGFVMATIQTRFWTLLIARILFIVIFRVLCKKLFFEYKSFKGPKKGFEGCMLLVESMTTVKSNILLADLMMRWCTCIIFCTHHNIIQTHNNIIIRYYLRCDYF